MNFDWYEALSRDRISLEPREIRPSDNAIRNSIALTLDEARYLYEKNRIITVCADGHAVGLSLEGGGEDG
jgi:hypothetical protein